MKHLQFNTRERAISTDHNRLQAFAERALGETFRYLLNVHRLGDGQTVEDATVASPLSAEIINGLCPIPQIASASLFIEPGLVGLIDDTSDTTDNSHYKLISDPGVQTAGVLTLVANSSGQTRIDVIECSRSIAKFTSSDSRDIFDNSTGAFTASSVTKTTEDGLSFRVRAGTPGAGFPGTASGWLPLAVCIVPTGSTIWDTVDVFDVRPLISDRERVAKDETGLPRLLSSRINGVNPVSMAGSFDALYAGRHLGGVFSAFNARSANNQAPSTSFASANTCYFIFALVPFGLPRWCKYSSAGSGSRVPTGPKGIMVVTNTAPDSDGKPSSAIALPTVLGFGASTSAGVCFAAGTCESSNASGMLGDHHSGHVFTSTAVGGSLSVSPFTTGAGSTFATASWHLIAGTHYPAHASALILEVHADLTVDSPAYSLRQNLSVWDPVSGTVAYVTAVAASAMPAVSGANLVATGDAEGNVSTRVEVPLPSPGSGVTGTSQQMDMKWSGNGTVMSFGGGNTHIRVIGYRI